MSIIIKKYITLSTIYLKLRITISQLELKQDINRIINNCGNVNTNIKNYNLIRTNNVKLIPLFFLMIPNTNPKSIQLFRINLGNGIIQEIISIPTQTMPSTVSNNNLKEISPKINQKGEEVQKGKQKETHYKNH